MKGENMKKTNKPTFSKVALGAVTGMALTTGFANAALDVSGIQLDVSQVEVIGLTIMTALGVIWVVKKVISML